MKTRIKSTIAEPPAPTVDPAGEITDDLRTRIMLVDDHPLMRQGMRALIEQQKRFAICGEADTAPQALELAGKINPDLAIIDISLKSANGLELAKGLRVQVPTMILLVVSMHDEDVYAERALRAGAMGYVMKHEASEKVVAAIDRVMQGEIYVSDRLKSRMLHRFVQHSDPVISPMDQLTDREMEVFQHLGNGYGSREIAQLLNLSVKTIDSYREHLKKKLNLTSGGDLVRRAIQWMRIQTGTS